MNYNELKQLLKWLKIMNVKYGWQVANIKETFGLHTKSDVLDFMNKCMVCGFRVLDC